MKRLFLGMMFLALIPFIPLAARADVEISISLPPLIEFAAPPELVVIPETDVYVAPEVNADIFFFQGWWWRPWHGHWYYSRNYNSGWGYSRNVPAFSRQIPSGWRTEYREHRWQGHVWNYQRVPHQQVQSNWHTWEQNRHWEHQNSWGVQGMHPHPAVHGGQVREIQPARNVHQPMHEERSGHEFQQGRNAQPSHMRQEPGRNAQPSHMGQEPGRNAQPSHMGQQPGRNGQPVHMVPGRGNPESSKPKESGNDKDQREQRR